jgi:hypothetical protein
VRYPPTERILAKSVRCDEMSTLERDGPAWSDAGRAHQPDTFNGNCEVARP